MQPYEELEVKFGEFLDVNNVVACSSGTAALHLAFETLRLPPGSRVLVPDLSMIACARAVSMAGLTPVLVDCGADLNVDASLFERGGKRGHEAVLAVHTYGRLCDMRAIHRYASSRGIPVVEDMSEAHGVPPHPETYAACWSFYKNKTIGGEEGGAVAFPAWSRSEEGEEAAALARSLRCLGFTDRHDFTHVPRGHNYRMANLLAAPILDSLAIYPAVRAAIAFLEEGYDHACPNGWRMPERQAPWVYDFRVPGMTAAQQDRVVSSLQERGVAARHCFKPLHSQEEYRSCDLGYRAEEEEWGYRPRSDTLSREVVYVPFSLNLPVTEAQVFEIVRSCL